MCFIQQRKNVVDSVGWNKKLRLEFLEDRRMLATMLVTDLSDDTLGNLAGDGNLSLREAVEAINTGAPVDGIGPVGGNFGTSDTILFRSSLFGGTPQTLALTAGQLELTNPVTITGPAANLLTIDGQQNSRIFKITATSGDFVFSQIILTGGLTTGLQAPGGAIHSLTTDQLRIDNAELTVNGTTGNFSEGGAISAAGLVSIVNTRITDNFTEGTSGGGGGVFTLGDVTLTLSTIADNRTEGTFSSGGGINSSAIVTLNNSTVSGNRTLGAASSAGGVLGFAGIEMTESTISGNQTSGDTSSAGGISSSGVIAVTRSTIANNSTQGASAPGGGIFVSSTDINVSGSIVANNTAGGGNNDIGPGSGTLSVEFSLIGDASGLGVAAATNILNQDPLLAALANNGGLTETHAPQTGSPVIDAGNANSVSPPLFDQRGIPMNRIADGDGNGSFVIDMGSLEIQTPSLPNADFNEDDVVDGVDFLRWQRGFGIMGGATRADGDSNQDGNVDGVDLGNWNAQYGTGAPSLAAGTSALVDLAIALELSELGETDAESASVLQPVSVPGDGARDQAFAASSSAGAAGVEQEQAAASSSEDTSQSSIDLALEQQLVVAAL
ncbi:MAG: choice-of-anchor Q domain-containing protein [Bythopirellula sp.]